MKSQLNIIAGENIPYVKEAFEGLGNLSIVPGRKMASADLQHTHILLIRSITQVNEALLQGTPVEFVGTASAGTNHMDTAYLHSKKIRFASAGGSNANSVAEYVMAALLLLSKQQGISLKDKTIGIVGVGNIGRLVKHKAEALGMHPVLNDPPLAERGTINHRPLKEALGCDVVTLHTPLTTDEPHPTYHLLNKETFKWVRPSTIFINASRGEVVDTSALLKTITHKHIGPTIIDVWENEPEINWDLFKAVTLGTPHIAGHSLDGKANGTFMIYAALCSHLGIVPTWHPAQTLPPPRTPLLETSVSTQGTQKEIQEIITKLYDIEADFHYMQHLHAMPSKERATQFDAFRKNYPIRREFQQTRVKITNTNFELRKILEGLGFPTVSC